MLPLLLSCLSAVMASEPSTTSSWISMAGPRDLVIKLPVKETITQLVAVRDSLTNGPHEKFSENYYDELSELIDRLNLFTPGLERRRRFVLPLLWPLIMPLIPMALVSGIEEIITEVENSSVEYELSKKCSGYNLTTDESELDILDSLHFQALYHLTEAGIAKTDPIWPVMDIDLKKIVAKGKELTSHLEAVFVRAAEGLPSPSLSRFIPASSKWTSKMACLSKVRIVSAKDGYSLILTPPAE